MFDVRNFTEPITFVCGSLYLSMVYKWRLVAKVVSVLLNLNDTNRVSTFRAKSTLNIEKLLVSSGSIIQAFISKLSYPTTSLRFLFGFLDIL